MLREWIRGISYKALFLEALGSPPRLLLEEGYVLALWDKA
jgi:hypothetical protein